MGLKIKMDTDDWEEMMEMKENTLENKVLKWAGQRNIINGSTSKDQLCKLVQELGEVSDAICKSDKTAIKNEIGDMLVILAIIARMEHLSLDVCLQAAYEKIKDRRGVMYNGVFVKESDVEYEDIKRKIDGDL